MDTRTIGALGDAGTPNTDATYAGEVTQPYFRQRFAEFQQSLNAMDAAYRACEAVYFLTDPPDEGLYNLMLDYEQNAASIKAVAEQLNMAAAAANALGVRTPVLSIPGTLGGLPLIALGAGALAALYGVGTWLAYARGFTLGAETQLARVRGMAPDSTKPQIEAEMQKVATAAASVSDNALARIFSGFGDVAGIVKIAVVGFLGYMAWKSFNDVLDR